MDYVEKAKPKWGGIEVAFIAHVRPRQWDNLSKYFYDISKLVLGVSVVTQLARPNEANLIVVAFGIIAGVLFLLLALMIDRRDKHDHYDFQ